MKAVARLFAVYFAGAPLQRWCAAGGLLCIAAGMAMTFRYPKFLLVSVQGYSGMALILDAAFWLLPTAGILALFFGGSLMPLVFARLARGHYLYMLPYGRVRLLVSALGLVALLALLFAAIATMLYWAYPLDLRLVFAKALFVAFFCFGLMYGMLWFISRARSALALLASAMLMIATLALPLQFIQIPATMLRWPAALGGLLVGLAMTLFLFAPRLGWLISLGKRFFPSSSNARVAPLQYAGREVDFFMGTARPWTLAVGQALPIGIATYFIHSPGIWLFYFALFSVIAGGMASLAATRSRCLWLRVAWSREQLFMRVEASFWLQSVYSLVVLALLLAGIGIYLEFEFRLLAFGLPLIALGAVVSLYLGLMMTRDIQAWDATFAIGSMLTLMAVALGIADPKIGVVAIFAGEFLLAGLALVFRRMARSRWESLDWALCRAEAATAVEVRSG